MIKYTSLWVTLAVTLCSLPTQGGPELCQTSFHRHGQVVPMLQDLSRMTLPAQATRANLTPLLDSRGLLLESLECPEGSGVCLATLGPSQALPQSPGEFDALTSLATENSGLGWAGPVFFSDRATTLTTGRIWIFTDTDPDYQALGLTLDSRLSGLRSIRVVRPAGRCPNVVELANELFERHGLDAVPELMRRFYPMLVPDDTYYDLQWYLNNTGDNVTSPFTGQPIPATAGADIRAESAWDQTMGLDTVLVGVIDTGTDCDHPDLTGKCGPGLNAITNQPDASPPDPGTDIGAGHGTSVASVSAGAANSVGVVGVCPNCGIIPVRMLEQATFLTDEMMLRAFVHAVDEGASVINNSWGPAGAGYFVPIMTGELEGIEYAGANNTLVVYAAGNENQSTDLLGHLQTGYDHVLAVAASDQFDLKSEYSNYGPHISLAAPTNDIYLGPAIYAAEIQGNGNVASDYTSRFGGTSSAAPVVSGVAALVFSAAPQLTAADVAQILYDTADKVDPDGGLYDQNGHSIKYGYGRVNANRAVLAALGQPDRPWCETPAAEEDCATHIDENCDDYVDEGCHLAPTMGTPCTDAVDCGAAPYWVCPVSGQQQGLCTWACTELPCSPGSTCLDGYCSLECQQNADCPAGFVCSDTQLGVCLVACSSDQDCGPDEYCDLTTQLCRLATDGQIGSPCIGNEDCLPGGFCLGEAMGFPGGYCTIGCNTNEDCGSGDFPNRCVLIGGMGNFCYRGCSFDGDCRENYLCMQAGPRAGTCYKHCTRDGQCTGDDPSWETIVCDLQTGRCIDIGTGEDGGPDAGVDGGPPDAGPADEDIADAGEDAGQDAGADEQPSDPGAPDGSPQEDQDVSVDAGVDAGSDPGSDPGTPKDGDDGCGCASSSRAPGQFLLFLLLLALIRRKS